MEFIASSSDFLSRYYRTLHLINRNFKPNISVEISNRIAHNSIPISITIFEIDQLNRRWVTFRTQLPQGDGQEALI